MEPTLTRIAAAARLGVFRATVSVWLEEGRFPGAVRKGRRWFIPVAAVDAVQAELPKPDGLVSMKEAALRLDLSLVALQRYAWEGVVEGVRINRRLWFKSAALKAFERDRAKGVASARRRIPPPQLSPPPSGFLTIPQAAAARGVSLPTMYRLAKEGIAPAVRTAEGRWLIPAERVQERLRERRKPGRPSGSRSGHSRPSERMLED